MQAVLRMALYDYGKRLLEKNHMVYGNISMGPKKWETHLASTIHLQWLSELSR